MCSAGRCACKSAGTVSFARDIQAIFSRSCATRGCHAGLRPQAGLNLSQGAAYAEIVGVASEQCGASRVRVAPGDPAASYLVDKLLGVDLCFGTQMPKAGVSLPQADLDAIGSWVCSGAANN
jgi:hypothetical protein